MQVVRTVGWLAVLGVAASLCTASAKAQETAPAAAAPDPLEVVRAMAERLRSLQDFTVVAEMTSEEVLESGEKLTTIEQVTADVSPPHGLRMSVSSPGRERILLYDGTDAVLWGPATGYYTKVPFTGNLAELTIEAAAKYDYVVPLADLFLWGRDAADFEEITEANFVGASLIDGRLCDHYAFRQEGVDWQVWVDGADDGLPCRYAITDLTDPARPTFSATLTITTGATFADRRFTFAPPQDALSIPFATTETSN